MTDCIFCKIKDKQIPADVVYEDEHMLCFKDIQPAAPVHLLLIPKTHLDSLAHAEGQHEALLGKMMLKVPQIAADAGLSNGFKTQINTGKGGGQEVFHLHIHIFRAACTLTKTKASARVQAAFMIFLKYSELKIAMIRRWLALTYYLYALRLAALSHFHF